MIDCPKCKVAIEDDSWYCDQCGQELKVCPQCATFGKGNRCTQCGTVLITAKQKAEGVVTPAAPTVIQPVVQPVTPPVSQPEVQVPPAPNVESTIRKPTEPQKKQKIVLVNHSLGIRLSAQEGAIIGRKNGPYSHLLSSQGYISGTHARFDIDHTGFWSITDLDSTNGTFYNGVQLKPNVPHTLYLGSKVTIADLELVVDVE